MEFIVDHQGTSKIVLEAYYKQCVKRCLDDKEEMKEVHVLIMAQCR